MKSNKFLIFVVTIAIAILLINVYLIVIKFPVIQQKLTGHASGYVNITINTQITINATNNTINWGPGVVTPGFTNATLYTLSTTPAIVTGGNWSNASVNGLVISNIGNINCSLYIQSGKTAATFFAGSTEYQAYKWNVSNKYAESCINSTGLGNGWSNWTDVNTSNPSGTKYCTQFGFLTNKNSINIDILLRVPYDALSQGAQSDIITVTGSVAG